MEVDDDDNERDNDPPYNRFYKTRPCKWIILQQWCPDGWSCFYAHSASELRPKPPLLPGEEESCEHWQGAHVAIGVVEEALFWDVPPPGTSDVVCNRCSPLGNPFAKIEYGPGEERPPLDEAGWCRGEHEYLCEAFGEYLAAVLNTESQDTLGEIVDRISVARRLTFADTWVAQDLQREDVLRALRNLREQVATGQRLRLLCHCRPFIRCHTELLKAHIEESAPQGLVSPTRAVGCRRWDHEHMKVSPWPGSSDFGPECAARRCRRSARAFDPGNMKMYCAQCWSQLHKDLQWLSERVANGQTVQEAFAAAKDESGTDMSIDHLQKESTNSCLC